MIAADNPDRQSAKLLTVAADDFVVRIHHLERGRPRLDGSEQDHMYVAPENVFQERLVHPQRDDRSGGVADERLENLESRTTGCAQTAALDSPGNRHLLARLQRGNRLQLSAIFIAKRARNA